MRRFLLLFAAVFLSLAAFAETSKLTVEKPKEQTTFSQTTTDGITWTFNVTWKTSAPTTALGVDSSKGYQIGSKTYPATSVVVTSSGLSTANITSITVNTSGASSIQATLGATVNGVTYQYNGADTYPLTSTATNVKFEGSEAGEVTLTYSNTSDKAIYIKSITVEYTTGGGGSKTLSFDKSSVELTYGDVFTAPTLDHADGLTINWSSTNTDVATVDGKGIVKIEGIGTTKITATDASDNTNTASYTITVKDPNAIEHVLTVDVLEKVNTADENAYKTKRSYTTSDGTVYAAQFFESNGIQLNKNTNSPGIVVTANPNGYILSKVTVTWNANCTAGRSLEIYGSNEAYTATSELNAKSETAKVTKGTLIGSLTSKTDTELDVTGAYRFIGIRALEAVNIDKITLVWVPAPGNTSGVESVVVDNEGAVEYFNLQGVRVEGALTPGIYIRRTATGTSKVAIR